MNNLFVSVSLRCKGKPLVSVRLFFYWNGGVVRAVGGNVRANSSSHTISQHIETGKYVTVRTADIQSLFADIYHVADKTVYRMDIDNIGTMNTDKRFGWKHFFHLDKRMDDTVGFIIAAMYLAIIIVGTQP